MDLEYPHWNAYVQHRYSNEGFLISSHIFANFNDFSMYIVPINDDIYNPIIKSSNLAKIGAELNKPMFEYRCWTLEFLRRNSYVQHLYSKSNQGFPRLGNRQMCVYCAVVKFSNCDGIWWTSIKFCLPSFEIFCKISNFQNDKLNENKHGLCIKKYVKPCYESFWVYSEKNC